MFRLEMFGRLALVGGRTERPQPRRRLALFARLALSGEHGVSRDELMSLFWPERESDAARHSLDQLIYEARRAFEPSPTIGTGFLRLNPDVIANDVAAFRRALGDDDLPAAVAIYRGPFLHAFYLHGVPEFERWIDRERSRFAGEFRRALETLATRAMRNGNAAESVEWWRRLVTDDQFSSRAALGFMQALTDAGDSAGALEFARVHERVVRSELESQPDPAVAAFAESLRRHRGSSSLGAPPRFEGDPRSTPTPPIAKQNGHDRERRAGRRHRALGFAAVGVALVAAVYGSAVLHRVRAETARASGLTSPGTRAVLRAGTTKNAAKSIEAHDLYTRAQDRVLLRSDSGVQTAIAYLRQVIALDSTYAPAYATLASRFATAAYSSDVPAAERRVWYQHAEAAARQAVALDDSLADAHAQLGYALMVGYKFAAAEAELKRAIALDPTLTDAREALIKVYEWTSRPSDALMEARRAIRIDPLSPGVNAELGYALHVTGQDDQAIEQLMKVAAIQPPLRRIPVYRAAVLTSRGRWAEAIAVLRPVAARDPHARTFLASAFARSGARAEATEILNEMLDAESRGLARAGEILEIYAALGDYDRAFAWLDRAFEELSIWADIMDPINADLHNDPRFERARRRVGLSTASTATEAGRARAVSFR